MVMKKVVLFFIVLLFVSFVLAQDPSAIGEGLQDQVGSVRSNVSAFNEKDKYDFLTEQWKGFLLENKIIAGINGFFTKINIIFLILMGRSWELSIPMFFTFLLWLFTLLIMPKFMLFFDGNGMKFLGGLLSVIVLAQLRLFKFLGDFIFKAVYFKDALVWKIIAYIVVFVFFILYLKVGGLLAKRIEKKKEENKKKEFEINQKKVEGIVEGLEEGT